MTDAEKNRRVAEWLGANRPPSREYAAAKVAWTKVHVTGPVFKLHDGRMMQVPGGKSLKQPEGSGDWNDRYGLYIAEQLGEELTDEIDTYRLPPPSYTTDLNACAEFEKRLKDLQKTAGDKRWRRYAHELGREIDAEDGFAELYKAATWNEKQRLFTFYRTTATAVQRVDALLRVIGDQAG